MKSLAWILFLLLASINVFLSVSDLESAGSLFGPQNDRVKGLDLMMRRNEAHFILKGVDPFRVWTREIVQEPYYPYVRQDMISATVYEPINAYTPWEYPVVIPYALMPKQVAWGVHFLLMMVSFALIVLYAFRRGGPWAAAAACLFVIPINVDVNVGNYGLVITAAVVGMLVCLSKGWQILAGCFWTIAMFKPQLALLLVVPLVFRRKWTTIITAMFVCSALTIVSSILCHTSPIVLLREAPAASVHAFTGCALMPMQLYTMLTSVLTESVCLLLSMFVGAAICVVLTWHIRETEDWFVFSAPSLLCAMAWTYVQPHSYILGMIVSAIIVADIIARPTICRFLIAVPGIMLMARFARGAEIVAGRFVPSLLPAASWSVSMSATIAFVLIAIYLWWYIPKTTKDIKSPPASL